MKVSRRVVSRYIADRLMAGDDQRATLKLLAAYIVEHKLQNQSRLMFADITRQLAEAGQIHATVTTARSLDKSLVDEVERFIRMSENAQSVEMDFVIDPALLGGIVIETPNKSFDSSVKTRLKRLRAA